MNWQWDLVFKVMYPHRCHRICCLRTDSLVVFAINTKKYSCRYPTHRNFTLHPQEAGYAAHFLWSCSMMWAANNLYMINMPLFIIDELHLTDKLAGEMIGIAAGLEIPMMLIAGYYMKRIGKRLLMLIAIVSGMCFYASVLMATTPAVELELQILNAIFLGILCGIGMLYFSGPDA